MLRFLTLLALLLLTLPARAEVPLDGDFTATAPCPAFQSIRRGTNPGNITLRPGTTYDLVAANKPAPTHLSVDIPGAEPNRRWVAMECGTTGENLIGEATTPPIPQTYRGTQFILAVNWQPAFCELSPGKTECRNQRATSFEATNFTLHGLWPQPRNNEYCNVSGADRMASESGRWRDIAPLDLTLSLRRDLNQVMPGSQSGLDRHEWIKHGTCYSSDARDYYTDALDLMLALNTSEVAELFADNIGKRITLAQIRDAFDASFGSGAGDRVRITCEEDGNRTLITELSIGLTGTMDGPDSFAQMIAAAGPTDGGCRSGQVDAVGLR